MGTGLGISLAIWVILMPYIDGYVSMSNVVSIVVIVILTTGYKMCIIVFSCETSLQERVSSSFASNISEEQY